MLPAPPCRPPAKCAPTAVQPACDQESGTSGSRARTTLQCAALLRCWSAVASWQRQQQQLPRRRPRRRPASPRPRPVNSSPSCRPLTRSTWTASSTMPASTVRVVCAQPLHTTHPHTRNTHPRVRYRRGAAAVPAAPDCSDATVQAALGAGAVRDAQRDGPAADVADVPAGPPGADCALPGAPGPGRRDAAAGLDAAGAAVGHQEPDDGAADAAEAGARQRQAGGVGGAALPQRQARPRRARQGVQDAARRAAAGASAQPGAAGGVPAPLPEGRDRQRQHRRLVAAADAGRHAVEDCAFQPKVGRDGAEAAGPAGWLQAADHPDRLPACVASTVHANLPGACHRCHWHGLR